MLIAFLVALVALVASCLAFALTDPTARAAASTCLAVAQRTCRKARRMRADSSIAQRLLERDRHLERLPARRRRAMADELSLLVAQRVVKDLLTIGRAHVHSVWLFGSRSLSGHRAESDLDMAVYYGKGLRPRILLGLSLFRIRSRLLLEYGVLLQPRLIPSDDLLRVSRERRGYPQPRPTSGICVYSNT